MSPSSRPIRLVHLIPRDGLGGVETAARAMAARTDLDCDFRLVFLEGEPIGRDGSAATFLRLRSALNPQSVGKAARAIVALAPDLLICSLWRSVPLALAVKALRPSVKLIAFLHAPRRTHLIDDLAHRLLLRAADACWADSGSSLDAAAERHHQPRRTISFLTERRAALAPPVPAPTFVSWGRLHPHKGLDRSIALIHALHGMGIAAELDLWGPDQGEGDRLRVLCARLGVAGHVRFRGPLERQRLQEVAANASFYLQTSLFEGYGMALAEAMQLGLVPVVTPVGEVAGRASHGVSALFLDPATPLDTARQIAGLLSDPVAFAAMRQAAIATFAAVPLYPEEMCRAAADLIGNAR